MPAIHQTHSVEQTVELGRSLGGERSPGQCLGLIGPLGAGKTALVRGLAEGLGCEASLVSSPTYVLAQAYPLPGGGALYHLDLYRMADPAAELADLGLEDMLADGVVVIEWADRAADVLPRPRLDVRIDIDSPTQRRITLDEVGPAVTG